MRKFPTVEVVVSVKVVIDCESIIVRAIQRNSSMPTELPWMETEMALRVVSLIFGFVPLAPLAWLLPERREQSSSTRIIRSPEPMVL